MSQSSIVLDPKECQHSNVNVHFFLELVSYNTIQPTALYCKKKIKKKSNGLLQPSLKHARTCEKNVKNAILFFFLKISWMWLFRHCFKQRASIHRVLYVGVFLQWTLVALFAPWTLNIVYIHVLVCIQCKRNILTHQPNPSQKHIVLFR